MNTKLWAGLWTLLVLIRCMYIQRTLCILQSRWFENSGFIPAECCLTQTGIVADNLSGSRVGTLGGQSQSVETEENFRRSGGTSRSPIDQQGTGSVASESYSADFDHSRGSNKAPSVRRHQSSYVSGMVT